MSRFEALLGGEEFVWLVDRLAQRARQGKPLDEGSAQLRNPSDSQRRAVDDLLGRRASTGAGVSVRLDALGELARSHGTSVAEVLRALRGPIENERARRDAERAAWEARVDPWRERLAAYPGFAEWLSLLLRDGTLKRFARRDPARADTLLSHAHQVLAVVDHGGALLASLAAKVTGDSHALDRGRSLGTLCLRGIHSLHGIDGTGEATARREAWAAIGVAVDDVSAPVLCLNLRVAAGSASAPWIDWHGERGEPFHLTWRQIRSFEPDPAMAAVFVCENPAIVSEAANRLGPRCRPLVCLNGRPTAAVKILLERIAAAGVPLRLRADFDWAGMKILGELLALSGLAGSALWRMTRDDYLACQEGTELRGTAFVRSWNRDLAAAMREKGFAGYEEEVLERLLADLGG